MLTKNAVSDSGFLKYLIQRGKYSWDYMYVLI